MKWELAGVKSEHDGYGGVSRRVIQLSLRTEKEALHSCYILSRESNIYLSRNERTGRRTLNRGLVGGSGGDVWVRWVSGPWSGSG